MNVEIIPQAQQDIAEAAQYYAEVDPGLAVDFLSEINRAVERVVQNPMGFEQVRSGIRRCLVARFPYGIYYRIPNESTIRITLVRHHSRHPGFGMRRT